MRTEWLWECWAPNTGRGRVWDSLVSDAHVRAGFPLAVLDRLPLPEHHEPCLVMKRVDRSTGKVCEKHTLEYMPLAELRACVLEITRGALV